MGLILAGDEHNRRSDNAFAGMKNVVKVVEDVLIFDKDFATHVEKVKSAVKWWFRARQNYSPQEVHLCQVQR